MKDKLGKEIKNYLSIILKKIKTMKKLIYLILLGLIVSSCNNPELKSKTLNKDVSVEIRYFDNTLDTLNIHGYEGIEDDLNLDGGDLFITNPYPYVYTSQVKTFKILKQ